MKLCKESFELTVLLEQSLFVLMQLSELGYSFPALRIQLTEFCHHFPAFHTLGGKIGLESATIWASRLGRQ